MHEDSFKSEVADLYSRMMAWLLNAVTLTALFMPVAFFLLMYDMVVVGHPTRRGSGYEVNEIVMAWTLPTVCAVGFGLRQLYRQVLTGQSFGMRRAGVKIADFRTGSTVSFRAALLRMCAPIVTGALGGVVALMTEVAEPLGGILLAWCLYPLSTLVNRTGRGWHDRLASTVLMQTDANT